MENNEVKICFNCKARIHLSDYTIHKDGNRSKLIDHFCGYSGLPITMSKEAYKKMKRDR